MIRQSQNYFAAAVSAAILNAAAIAAFVVFTMLSAAGGFPLQGLIGSANSVTSASTSESGPPGDGESAPLDRLIPGRGSGADSPTAPAATGLGANSTAKIGDTESNSSPGGTADDGAGSAPIGAATGAQGGSGGGGASGAGGEAPAAPTSPAAQQVSSAVSQLPSAINQGVGNAVDSADSAVGGGLSQSGVSQTVKGASNSLLGPGSAVSQAASGVGGVLQGPNNRASGASGIVGEVAQGTPLGG